MTARINEPALRIATGAVLWTVSGLLTVSLFLTLAAGDPVKQAVAVLWAVGLEGAKVLTWRRGGWWRALAGLLVAVTVFSAFGMAVTSVEQARAGSREAQLAVVRSSAEYVQAQASLAADRELLSILTARLASTPADYVTAARALSAQIDAVNGRVRGEGLQLVAMESQSKQSGTASRTMFDVLGGQAATYLEVVVSLVVACLTELFALTLSGTAQVREHMRERTPERSAQAVAQPQPAAPAPKPSADLGEERAYLETVRRLQGDGKPFGYRQVAASLGVSEGKARGIMERLKARQAEARATA